MNPIYKILFGFLIIALLTFLVFLFMISSAFSSNNMCGNTIVKTKLSPNKNSTIVLFERSCGATTGFSYQVDILENDNDLDNINGNILIMEKDSLNIM